MKHYFKEKLSLVHLVLQSWLKMTKDVPLMSPFNNWTFSHLETQQRPANGEVEDEVDDQGQQGGEYHEGPETEKKDSGTNRPHMF